MIDWLLKGEPRAVQVEALNRSYGGFKVKSNQHDENETPIPLTDRFGFTRTGPATGWAHLMEQRLGKTPTELNEFALFRRDHGLKWCLLFAPNQFKPEWGEEAERFGLDCAAHVFHSDDRSATQRFIDKNEKNGGLIAVNYESLIYPGTMALLEQIAGDETLVAGDESVCIKNNTGSQFKAALALAKNCKVRRILTGKPVVQGPHDLWAQLRMIGELDGFNYYAFRNTFCKLGGFQGKKVVGSKNEDRLNDDILSHCAFNARRVDWLTTAGREYARRPVEMISEQKTHYRSMEQEFVAELNADTVISADQIITKLIKLAQISSGFIIDEDGRTHDIMPPSSNPKLLEAQRMMREEITSKTIFFCHHTHSMDQLEAALAEFNPCVIRSAGWHRSNNRDVQAEKLAFNSDPSRRVMIGQEQSIKYGHTLMGAPGDPCLNAIFYENNYSLNDRSQCEERPQGEGQQGLLTIWDFLTSPIERQAIEALIRKENVAAATLRYARSTGVLAA